MSVSTAQTALYVQQYCPDSLVCRTVLSGQQMWSCRTYGLQRTHSTAHATVAAHCSQKCMILALVLCKLLLCLLACICAEPKTAYQVTVVPHSENSQQKGPATTLTTRSPCETSLVPGSVVGLSAQAGSPAGTVVVDIRGVNNDACVASWEVRGGTKGEGVLAALCNVRTERVCGQQYK